MTECHHQSYWLLNSNYGRHVNRNWANCDAWWIGEIYLWYVAASFRSSPHVRWVCRLALRDPRDMRTDCANSSHPPWRSWIPDVYWNTIEHDFLSGYALFQLNSHRPPINSDHRTPCASISPVTGWFIHQSAAPITKWATTNVRTHQCRCTFRDTFEHAKKN